MTIKSQFDQIYEWLNKLPEVSKHQHLNPEDPNWMGTVDGWVGDIKTHLELIQKESEKMEYKLARLAHMMDNE